MGKNICKNPECGVIYDVENEKSDLGCCSFECWEKTNCGEPAHAEIQELVLE